MNKLIFFAAVAAISVTGCAGNHAQVTVQQHQSVNKSAWVGKSFAHDIYYSQPQPGVFTGGDQQPLIPLQQADLSIGSAKVLRRLPDYLFDQLPEGTKRGSNDRFDYKLVLEMIAHNKRGPSYPDFSAGESLATGLLTLGFAAASYDIVADYDLTCKLIDSEGKQLYEDKYVVKESLEHSQGDFEDRKVLDDIASQLLEKHLTKNINSCLTGAAQL